MAWNPITVDAQSELDCLRLWIELVEKENARLQSPAMRRINRRHTKGWVDPRVVKNALLLDDARHYAARLVGKMKGQI